MALNRLTIDGYGQIELTQATWPRDGRVEAQCKLDSASFASMPAENGMLVAVDNVTRKVKIATNANLPIGVVYTSEHLYDERLPGLKNFKIEADDNLPRIGFPTYGDKWTTNCLAYDTTEYTNDAAVITALGNIATTAMYGTYCANGAMKLTATKPTSGPVIKVIAKTTMPDGQLAVKVQVIA